MSGDIIWLYRGTDEAHSTVGSFLSGSDGLELAAERSALRCHSSCSGCIKCWLATTVFTQRNRDVAWICTTWIYSLDYIDTRIDSWICKDRSRSTAGLWEVFVMKMSLRQEWESKIARPRWSLRFLDCERWDNCNDIGWYFEPVFCTFRLSGMRSYNFKCQ